MLKLLYRIIILVFVFIGSLYYFSKDIKEEVFQTDKKTVEMAKASFPVVNILLDDVLINELHGYGSNINANLIRESITPITVEQNFTVLIDEGGNEVRRVIYEIREVNNNKLVETETINALEYIGENKSAKIRIKQELAEYTEYAVKITLVTSESKKMNYYTRIKKLPASYYKEKLDFVMEFHESIMDKEKAEGMIAYLEPKANADNSSFSYVNINSSFDMVSYKDLEPKVMKEAIPKITEINEDLALVELTFIVSCETEYGTEYYHVRELFRVRYTSSRMYLLNYERTMETIFNSDYISLSKNEYKLGITSEIDMEVEAKSGNSKIAFVRQRELWYYNLTEETAVKVFSFRQEDSDYIRDNYDQHDVRILKMDDDGNISFMVYGYMNRGVYEGQVGIVLYQYYSLENRIEELVYIPITIPYEILKEEINNFSYMNEQKIFYFAMNHKIYSYNLITKGLTVIAENVFEDKLVFSKDLHYIAYQDNGDPKESRNIQILDLETGSIKTISAKNSQERIGILGSIDDNIIYGYVNVGEIIMGIQGNLIVPMNKIEIADYTGRVLKTYEKEDYYVTSVSVHENIITLERVTKVTKNGEAEFVLVESDNILNKATTVSKPVEITKRITDKMKTEYYLSLPEGYVLEKKPVLKHSVNTIIHEDTTLRLSNTEMVFKGYMIYSYGKVLGIYDDLGEAVTTAYEAEGTVVDKDQRIVWERLIRSNTVDISNSMTKINTNSQKNSLMAAAQMLITHGLGNVSVKDENLTSSQLNSYLEGYFEDSLLNLTGASLEEVLYYSIQRRPIIAMKNHQEAVVIVGYDPYNITVYDPGQNRTMKIGLKDSAAMFKAGGNIFISYLK